MKGSLTQTQSHECKPSRNFKSFNAPTLFIERQIILEQFINTFMTTFGSLLDWKFGSFLVFLLQNQWLYSYAFLGTLLFADCVKIASNDNKFFLRATYFTNNPGGHHTMWTFFGSHFNFFSFNYSNMSKSNLNQHKCDKMRLRQKATHDTYKESNNTE